MKKYELAIGAALAVTIFVAPSDAGAGGLCSKVITEVTSEASETSRQEPAHRQIASVTNTPQSDLRRIQPNLDSSPESNFRRIDIRPIYSHPASSNEDVFRGANVRKNSTLHHIVHNLSENGPNHYKDANNASGADLLTRIVHNVLHEQQPKPEHENLYTIIRDVIEEGPNPDHPTQTASHGAIRNTLHGDGSLWGFGMRVVSRLSQDAATNDRRSEEARRRAADYFEKAAALQSSMRLKHRRAASAR